MVAQRPRLFRMDAAGQTMRHFAENQKAFNASMLRWCGGGPCHGRGAPRWPMRAGRQGSGGFMVRRSPPGSPHEDPNQRLKDLNVRHHTAQASGCVAIWWDYSCNGRSRRGPVQVLAKGDASAIEHDYKTMFAVKAARSPTEEHYCKDQVRPISTLVKTLLQQTRCAPPRPATRVTNVASDPA